MNNTNSSSNQNQKPIDYLYLTFTHIPLVLIALGVVGNTVTFLMLRLHREFKSMSSMVYLSFVCVTDTLSLFVWNLDNYLYYNLKFYIEALNESVCKVTSFQQYFSLQSSALILSMVTIDRYVTVISVPGSLPSRLPFRTPKSALFWSLIICFIIALINSHVMVFPRLKTAKKSGNVTKYSFECRTYENGFRLFPFWENIHLFIFSVIPFILMTIFNGLLIKNVMNSAKSLKFTSTSSNSIKKKTRVTISLVIVTILFLVMTLPGSIFYSFLYTYFSGVSNGQLVLICMDSLSFMNSASLFFITLATNSKFRLVFCNDVKFILAKWLDRKLISLKKYPSTSVY